jgi:hypothetical protein
MDNKSPVPNDRLLNKHESLQLHRLVLQKGEEEARRTLGVGKLPFARLAAGFPVLRATLSVARGALQELRRDGSK